MSVVYVKSFPRQPKKRKNERYFFGFLLSLGALAIIFSAYPFFVWQFSVLPKFNTKINEIPVPQAQVLSEKTNLNSNVQVVQEPDGFSYFTTNFKPQDKRPEEFYISIPKIKVEEARVVVDDIKFDTHLALFPGTAIPGEAGNVFITGHSVLPQFADSKNYRAIFTNLSDMEVGDNIDIDLEGKKIRYIVQYSKVVDPKDTSVLLPISPNGKNLTLMSCVPPGTSSKRLVVIASLI